MTIGTDKPVIFFLNISAILSLAEKMWEYRYWSRRNSTFIEIMTTSMLFNVYLLGDVFLFVACFGRSASWGLARRLLTAKWGGICGLVGLLGCLRLLWLAVVVILVLNNWKRPQGHLVIQGFSRLFSRIFMRSLNARRESREDWRLRRFIFRVRKYREAVNSLGQSLGSIYSSFVSPRSLL